MENDWITQSQMLGYNGIVYRYSPSHVKNGLVILLCIFERTIVFIWKRITVHVHIHCTDVVRMRTIMSLIITVAYLLIDVRAIICNTSGPIVL